MTECWFSRIQQLRNQVYFAVTMRQYKSKEENQKIIFYGKDGAARRAEYAASRRESTYMPPKH